MISRSNAQYKLTLFPFLSPIPSRTCYQHLLISVPSPSPLSTLLAPLIHSKRPQPAALLSSFGIDAVDEAAWVILSNPSSPISTPLRLSEPSVIPVNMTEAAGETPLATPPASPPHPKNSKPLRPSSQPLEAQAWSPPRWASLLHHGSSSGFSSSLPSSSSATTLSSASDGWSPPSWAIVPAAHRQPLQRKSPGVEVGAAEGFGDWRAPRWDSSSRGVRADVVGKGGKRWRAHDVRDIGGTTKNIWITKERAFALANPYPRKLEDVSEIFSPNHDHVA
jgi:hypothetical protein